MLRRGSPSTPLWVSLPFYHKGERTLSTLILPADEPCRATYNAPKPNTRFLKNILRETDNHNTALKERELTEARQRLKRLRGEDERDNRSSVKRETRAHDSHETKEKHSRRRDDNRVDRNQGHRTKRRRHDSPSPEDVKKQEHKGKRSSREPRGREVSDEDKERHNGREHREERSSRKTRRRELSDENEEYRQQNSHKNREKRRCDRDDEPESVHRRHSRSRERTQHSRYTAKHYFSFPKPDRKSDHRNSRNCSRSRDPRKTSSIAATQTAEQEKDDDSDPLEAIIGPPEPPLEPQVRPRGRGQISSTSGMDARFSSKYDPTTDVRPNSDSEDDWGLALEALKDRQRWKQQGADRLKAAGFTEDEISKWEKGDKKSEVDVKWKGRGEKRDWDSGKVLNEEDGVYDTKAEWARLQ
jgi:hypothetical protein